MNDIPEALYVVGGPLAGTHIPRLLTRDRQMFVRYEGDETRFGYAYVAEINVWLSQDGDIYLHDHEDQPFALKATTDGGVALVPINDVEQSAALIGNTNRLGELEDQLDEALDAARPG
jgi:hypothetical protein